MTYDFNDPKNDERARESERLHALEAQVADMHSRLKEVVAGCDEVNARPKIRLTWELAKMRFIKAFPEVLK